MGGVLKEALKQVECDSYFLEFDSLSGILGVFSVTNSVFMGFLIFI